jgi:hypothetical protein
MARFRDSILAGWPGLTALVWLAAIIDSVCGAWAGWLAAWLPGCLAAWLPGCLVVWLPGCLAAWLLGWLVFLRLHEISWISIDFEVRGYRRIRTFAAEMMPLKKALLDSS